MGELGRSSQGGSNSDITMKWLLVFAFATSAQSARETTTRVSACETAILRCCSPGLPAIDSTWRCFEKNNCDGLFSVLGPLEDIDGPAHNNKQNLGACAYFPMLLEKLETEGLQTTTPTSKTNKTTTKTTTTTTTTATTER